MVDDTGKVLDTTVIYPTAPQNKVEEAKTVLKKLIRKADGVVVNPFGFGLKLDMEKAENIERQFGGLRVVK